MSKPVLTLQGITRRYATGDSALEILRGLNLTLNTGEIVALVGPSGSGKTTLLQIAGLLDAPDAGEIALHGSSLQLASESARTAARRSSIGFVYQSHHLLPEFSALENVILPQLIGGVPFAQAKKKAAELLTDLGLASRLTHRPAKLSGGEQQRVAIARALANNPAVLLADEPTGNLDPATAEEVFQLFLRISRERGVAALVATHNMELAKRMDREVRLENGRLY